MESNDALLVVGDRGSDADPDVANEVPAAPAGDLLLTSGRQLSLASMAATLDAARASLAGIASMLGRLAHTGPHDEVAATEAVGDEALPTVPRWHFAMLNDNDRNDAFAVALERVVPPGGLVLDIGSGTGLLAMMAARAGAGSVVTCEANPLLAEMARQIVALHGLSGVVTVLPKLSTELRLGVDLPRRADLVVSEVVDCGLIGEGVLPTVRHARQHLLAPGGTLLPASARIVGALLHSPAIDRLNRVHTAAGFDVSLLNAAATRGHFPVRLPTWPHRLLSEPAELVSFDFARDPLRDGDAWVELTATDDGHAHAVVAWFEMDLGAGVVVRNPPDNVSSHWMQACIPFAEPLAVTTGAAVPLRLSWQGTRLSIQLSQVPSHPEVVT